MKVYRYICRRCGRSISSTSEKSGAIYCSKRCEKGEER